MPQSEFKYIIQKEDGIYTTEGKETLTVNVEIAYQLKRIADALERKGV